MEPIRPGTPLCKWRPIPRRVRLRDCARARVPCRTHLSVLDMRRFSPGNPGGGGIGHAVGLYATAEVTPSEEWVIESKRSHVVEHIARIVAGFAGYDGALHVKAEDHGIRHLGLGSTSALMTAVSLAVNHLLGRPFDFRELRFIVGKNFVEDHPNGVIPGFETGVGPAVGIYGGFVVLTDSLEIALRTEISADRVVVAVMEELPERDSGEAEVALLMNMARSLDEVHAQEKAHIVLLDLLPAAVDKDLDAMTECIRRMQVIGSKVAEIDHHKFSNQIREVAQIMRSMGAHLAGMSSVGPSVTCVADHDSARRIANRLEGMEGVREVLLTDMDNRGAVIEDG